MFAEMSLDNLTVVELRTVVELTAAAFGLLRRLSRYRDETI
jgi:hypothetical protein